MKNVIKIIKKNLLLAMLCAGMLGNANEISSNINKEDLKGTALTLNNVKEGNLLTIKDYNGIVLYKELIKITGTYKKGFDLTALPNGDYFFEVDKDLEITTIPFSVKFNEVTFNKEKEITIFKPYARQKNDLLYISKLSPNLEPLKISIYADTNEGYELLHTEKIEGVQTIEKVYKLEKGNYKLVFNTNDKEFTKFINN